MKTDNPFVNLHPAEIPTKECKPKFTIKIRRRYVVVDEWFNIFKENLIMATVCIFMLLGVICIGFLVALIIVKCSQFSIWLGILSVIVSFLFIVGLYSYTQYIIEN